MDKAVGGGPECQSLMEEVVGGVDSGLVGLYMKGGLTGKPFTIRRNWPALGGPSRVGKAPDIKA